MTIRHLLHNYGLAVWCVAEQRMSRLLPAAIRIARARLKYGIGPLPFSLFRLGNVPEAHWSDYLVKKTPVDLQLMSVNVEPGRSITGNKLRMYQHCRNAGLPTIPVLCSVGNLTDAGITSVEHVADSERFETVLAAAPDRLFFKPVRGSLGEGAFVVARDPHGFRFEGRHGTAAELLAHVKHKCGPSAAFLVQPQVRPHPGLKPVMSANGLPTARLVTALYPDGPRLLFGCFKIPAGASVVDNFHNGLGGNLLAPIDLQTGTLAAARGSRRRDWPHLVQVDVHPDTGRHISGLRLPLWKELLDLALRGQRSLPALKTIGWDLAISVDGVLIVEGNYSYDMQILQMANQRGLRAEFSTLIDDLRNWMTPSRVTTAATGQVDSRALSPNRCC
jgi:hypothetical protein